MQKSFIGPLVTIIALVLVGAMFVYFYVSLNRMEEKVIAVQTAIAEDSSKITAIVNFFNANAQQNAQTNQ